MEMYQNNFFFIFKNLFLTSTHQNNPKLPKTINLKQKKIIFFPKAQYHLKNNHSLTALEKTWNLHRMHWKQY